MKRLIPIFLVLFITLSALYSADFDLGQWFIVQKVRGTLVIRTAAVNDDQFEYASTGLKAKGVSSDSLWFFWTWTLFDTTGGAYVQESDSCLNVTAAYRTVYDGIDMRPVE